MQKSRKRHIRGPSAVARTCATFCDDVIGEMTGSPIDCSCKFTGCVDCIVLNLLASQVPIRFHYVNIQVSSPGKCLRRCTGTTQQFTK